MMVGGWMMMVRGWEGDGGREVLWLSQPVL